MRKYLIFFLFSLSLFANDSILDIYRKNGLKNLEQTLDKALIDKSYWSKKAKESEDRFGWYEEPQYILFCNTTKKKLNLFFVNGKKTEKILSSDIVIGKDGIGKEKEGDFRTPIGVYKIVTKRDDIDPNIYGPFAYVLNYPNRLDRSFHRDGHGIWIHGFPLNCSDKNSTKGCVAAPNDNLSKIDKKIDYKKAVVIISPYEFNQTFKKDIASILSFIYKWRYYWKYDDFNNYISLYSKKLNSVYGNYKKFFNRKRDIFSRNYKKEIRFTNIKITPYPNLKKKSIWRVEMNEFYKAPNLKFRGKKILYLKKEGGYFKIWREY